ECGGRNGGCLVRQDSRQTLDHDSHVRHESIDVLAKRLCGYLCSGIFSKALHRFFDRYRGWHEACNSPHLQRPQRGAQVEQSIYVKFEKCAQEIPLIESFLAFKYMARRKIIKMRW